MIYDFVFNVLSWISILVGGSFLFVGSLCMVRLQDFWSRLHAASVIDSAGAGLLIFGMMLQTGFSLITVKFAIIVLFLMITGPTATHAVANAAFVSKSRPQDMIEDQCEPEAQAIAEQAISEPANTVEKA